MSRTLLIDEHVDFRLMHRLRSLGYNVVTARELG